MGSQQLLIIVLVVFVAGLAIVTGIRLVAAFNQSNERDMVLVQMQTVVGEAKKYYSKPRSIGGGEGSFENFEAAARFTVTDRIRIYPNIQPPNKIIFVGYGSVVGFDGQNPVQVVAEWDQTLGDWASIAKVN